MSRVEVLVATMNQTDLSLFKKMNIQTDVIFCNQCDRNEYIETEINGCRVRMISTATKGVGINRNIGMLYSEAEICLCADDDVEYVNNYENKIIDAFEKAKDATIIGFSLDDKIEEKGIVKKTHKLFGGPRIAFRNDKVKIANVYFSRLFGGGAKYGCGEDSFFCLDIKRKGLKLYKSDSLIGVLKDRTSSWFTGRDNKYFFDQGVASRLQYKCSISLLFWSIAFIIHIYFKFKDFNIKDATRWYYKGVKSQKKGLSYSQYIEQNNIK